jgi:hypothetical protein
MIETAGSAGEFEIHDERFRHCILGNAWVEKLHTGMRWAEGPAYFADGHHLVWSDIPNDCMLRWVEGGGVSVFRRPSHHSNGNTRDRQGRLVTCEHGARRVTRTEIDGAITVLADRFGGDASRVWTEATSGEELANRLGSLPGIGDMKVRALVATLVKQFGVKPPGWEAVIPGHPTLGDVDSAESRDRQGRDLVDDPMISFFDRTFLFWSVMSFLVPFGLGYALTGSWGGAFTGLLWGGLVRLFLNHHITWSVNSICHFFGRRPFAAYDQSTNNWLLAIPSLGEAWHHNHHVFPTSAFHGLSWRQVDISGWLIAGWEKLGLVRNVRRVSPEQKPRNLPRDQQAARHAES